MEINKEDYKESLENKIEEKKWAEKFLKTNDWKKLAGYISRAYPGENPYNMESLLDIKEQGGYIKGLTFPETLLNALINEGTEAIEELKSNPDAS